MPEILPLHPEATAERLASGYSVADLCRRWKIGADKIYRFLRTGELIGVNVAASLAAKPMWRFSPEAVQRFERRRSSEPPPKAARKRRRTAGEIDYFPD